METRKAYEGEYDENDRDIGLFDRNKIRTIWGASYKDIIIIKKLNITRTIYKFAADNIAKYNNDIIFRYYEYRFDVFSYTLYGHIAQWKRAGNIYTG